MNAISRKDFIGRLFVCGAAGTAPTLVLTGCHSVPTPEAMFQTAQAVGFSAGMICNLTKISDKDRAIVCDIMNIVGQVLPEQGQSFEDAWGKVAKDHLALLVQQGKISQVEADIIFAAFTTAVKFVDYLFNVRYPKAKEVKELVFAATNGFVVGFLTVFKPANPQNGEDGECADCCELRARKAAVTFYDRAAFDWYKLTYGLPTGGKKNLCTCVK